MRQVSIMVANNVNRLGVRWGIVVRPADTEAE